jgi:hypothetical protein
MNTLHKTTLFAAAATMTIWGLIQSPLAQTTTNVDPNTAMEEALRQMGINPHSTSATQQKADAVMMNVPDSPPTEADKKATTAMAR